MAKLSSKMAVPFCMVRHQWMRVPVAPHPCQHLVLSVPWILAILIGRYWYFIIVLIGISLMMYRLFTAANILGLAIQSLLYRAQSSPDAPCIPLSVFSPAGWPTLEQACQLSFSYSPEHLAQGGCSIIVCKVPACWMIGWKFDQHAGLEDSWQWARVKRCAAAFVK